MTTSGTRPLVDCATGHPVVLAAIDAPAPLARRLRELGLRVGVTIRAVRRTSGGGRVVAAGEIRVALDRDVAARLLVQELRT